jgi:hypothetical protein
MRIWCIKIGNVFSFTYNRLPVVLPWHFKAQYITIHRLLLEAFTSTPSPVSSKYLLLDKVDKDTVWQMFSVCFLHQYNRTEFIIFFQKHFLFFLSFFFHCNWWKIIQYKFVNQSKLYTRHSSGSWCKCIYTCSFTCIFQRINTNRPTYRTCDFERAFQNMDLVSNINALPCKFYIFWWLSNLI